MIFLRFFSLSIWWILFFIFMINWQIRLKQRYFWNKTKSHHWSQISRFVSLLSIRNNEDVHTKQEETFLKPHSEVWRIYIALCWRRCFYEDSSVVIGDQRWHLVLFQKHLCFRLIYQLIIKMKKEFIILIKKKTWEKSYHSIFSETFQACFSAIVQQEHELFRGFTLVNEAYLWTKCELKWSVSVD